MMNKSPKDQTSKSDAPVIDPRGNPPSNISKCKVKKNKKKKHPNRTESSASSSSLSDSVPPLLLNEAIKEQFYDAHESYHGLPENDPPGSPIVAPQTPTVPAVLTAPAIAAIDPTLLLVRSVHSEEPKLLEDSPAATRGNAGRSKKKPSTVTKPVTGPQ